LDLTAPPTLSLVGAAIRLRFLHSIGDGFFRLPPRLRGWLFPLTCPGPVSGPSRFPQSRPCGVLWSARYPCQLPFGSLDLTATPTLTLIGAAWSFRFRLPDLHPLGSGAHRRVFQAAHSALAAGTFHLRFLDPSLARLDFLSRDPAACSGWHEPLSAPPSPCSVPR